MSFRRKLESSLFNAFTNLLDPGFHRGDDWKSIFSHLRGGRGGGVFPV